MELSAILKMSEDELRNKLYTFLSQKGMNPIIEEGYIYAKGDIPILLVAHMDTVFNEPPIELNYNKSFDIIYSPEGGIGADDRCGIYAITKILKEYKPYVLFTTGEEIGGLGAEQAVNTLEKPNVKYMIELDRHGNNDCIFYHCGNKEFMKYIESFNFKMNRGTFTDISILGQEWDIAAVNLSIGYYNEHTDVEYIRLTQMEKNIRRVITMLKKHQKAKYYDYQKIHIETALEKINKLILSKQTERKYHHGKNDK